MTEFSHCFFALWPDEAARAAIVEAGRDLKVRMQLTGNLTGAERLHMTLLYLGSEITSLQEAAAVQVAQLMRLPPFTLTLNQALLFRSADAWVLVPQETPRELGLLHASLSNSLRRANVPIPRSGFKPHVTIRYGAGIALPPTQIRPIAWEVKEFVLIRSVHGQRGTEYQMLGRWLLNGEMPLELPPAQMNLWEN